jgi:hypothetical protein
MANALYGKGREGFLDGSIDWDTHTISAALIDTGTYVLGGNIDVHDNWDDASAGLVGSPVNLTGKTVTLGVADANDVTFTSVTGATVEAIIIFKDTGTPSTSRLIAYIDTGTGLPVTPNGGDIVVVWDSGSNKIFKL